MLTVLSIKYGECQGECMLRLQKHRGANLASLLLKFAKDSCDKFIAFYNSVKVLQIYFIVLR